MSKYVLVGFAKGLGEQTHDAPVATCLSVEVTAAHLTARGALAPPSDPCWGWHSTQVIPAPLAPANLGTSVDMQFLI